MHGKDSEHPILLKKLTRFIPLKKLIPFAPQFRALRQKEEEAPFSSDLCDEARDGIYRCAGCEQAAFHSAFKFDAGTGWPSFFNALADGVTVSTEDSGIKVRREVQCACCRSHLGFLWADGFLFDDCPVPPRPAPPRPLEVDSRFSLNGDGLFFEQLEPPVPPAPPRPGTGTLRR